MEWQCVILSGGVKFHFAFTDGTMTGYGVTPARYRTANPILQNVIENSNYFKSGKIFLERQVILEADAPVVKDAPELEKVEVSCLDDAKEYLAEHFGVNRLKLKNKQAIVAQATENKIEFVGI